MAVSFSSGRVSISTYKSGTTSGSSTTTLEITSGEIASGDVGRLVAVIPSTGNSGDVQVRQITGVSGGTISIHDPWVGTIASGTTWRVAHNLEDVHAIGATGLEKIGTASYRWNGSWNITSTGFLGDVDKSLEMTSGQDPAYRAANGGIIQFGLLYGGEGLGNQTTNGCRIQFRYTGNNQSIYTDNNGRVGTGPVLNYFGCLIESNTTGGWGFGRMNGPARFIGSIFDGPMGGRFYHERSEWIECRMSGNDDGTPAWSIGATFTRDINDVRFYRNLVAMKNYQDFGGSLRNIFFANNGDIINRSGDSGSTFNFIDSTEFDNSDTIDKGGVVNQFRSIVISTTDSGGVALGGVTFRVNDVDDTTQGSVQTSNASGELNEVLALRRKFSHNSTSLQTFNPFRLRYRKFGFLWQQLTSDIASPIKQSVAQLEDDKVTQSEAVAAAHTGITVTDHGGSPVTWQGKQWGITVTVDGPSAEDVKHYLHYHLSQTASFAGKPTGLHWHEFIPAFADETQRDNYGGTFKGVRIVDTSGSPIPGFDRFQSDDGTYFVPPVTFTLQLSGLETGSQVVVYESGTTNILATTNSSGTSFTYSDTGTAPTVDYTVLKGGFLPIRATGIALSGGTIVAQDPGQSLDRPYNASNGLTYTTDFTISISTGEITVNNPTTGRNIYSATIDAYINRESDTANTEFPLSMDGNASLTLDGIEFASGSIDNLSRTGFRYLDSGSLTAVYAAIQTTTLPSGTKLYNSQSDGGTWTLLTTGTSFDGMIQTFGDASHGSFDGRDFLTLKAVNDGYTVDEWNLGIDGGVSQIVDNFYFVPLSIGLTGETTGDPGVTVTVTNIPDETWNGVTVGVEVDTGAGVTGSEVLRHLTWQRFQGNLLEFGQLVLPLGDKYQSVRSRVYDGAPLEVEGVKVLQNGATHPDFSLFEGKPGETFTPAVSVTGSVDFTQTGSRVQIYNVTTGTELANEIVTGTTLALSQVKSSGTLWSSGDTIRIRVAYQDGLSAKNQAETIVVVPSSEEWSTTVFQEDDTVYDAYGINGSTITKFSNDFANNEVDVIIVANFTGQEFYSWYMSELMVADGIRFLFGAIEAIDTGNLRINNSVVNLKLDNTTTSNIIQIDNVRIFREDSAYPIINPTSGGGGIDINWRIPVLSVTSSSGITNQDKAEIASEVRGEMDSNSQKLQKIKNNTDLIPPLL